MKPLEHPLAGMPVVWSDKPFGQAPRRVEFPDGMTVGQMVKLAIERHGLPPRFLVDGYVCINGEEVPRAIWDRVRPRRGRLDFDVCVTFHLPLLGGGGGGQQGSKNPLATIALVAVLVVATFVSAGGLAALAPEAGIFSSPVFGGSVLSAFSAGSLAASLAGAAILVGGQLAIAALTAPPKITNSSVSDSQGKAASLSGNILAPGASIPRVVGTYRLFPPLICEPLNELVGEDEIVEAVYALAGPHALSAARAGDAALADIPQATFDLQEGLPESPIQNLVTRQGKTQTINAEMSRHRVSADPQYLISDQGTPENSYPQYMTLVSRDSPDEIWLRLAGIEGLQDIDHTDHKRGLPFRLQMRLRGDSTWIQLPEVHIGRQRTGAFQKDIRLIWAPMPVAPNVPPSGEGWKLAYKHVDGQNGFTVLPATPDWDAHSHFSLGSGDDYLSSDTFTSTNVTNVELYEEKVVFYLDEATFPKGVYEIQIKRGTSYNVDSFSRDLYTIADDDSGDLFSADFFNSHIASGQFRITCDQNNILERMSLRFIASIWHENPVQTHDLATIAVRAQGISLDQISVLASGYVLDYDGSGWNTLTTTSNPAPHYRDILGGKLNADPMPVDLIDDDDLVAWRQLCIDNEYDADMVVDGRAGFDVLTAIAGAGYARPRQSEKWGVLIDKDRSSEAPIQVFSPRNMQGFRFERPFPKKSTGFLLDFDDADNDYQNDQSVVVLDPLNPLADESRLEQQRYDAITNKDKAKARAQFDLKQATLRFAFFYGTVDAEAILCRRGDLVAVQHDVLTRQAGFSRIKSIAESGGNVTGLTLDGSIPVATEDAWSGTADAWSSYDDAWTLPRTGISIRLKDGTISTHEISATEDETKDITFVTPFALPDGDILDADCLVVSGPLTQEYSRMLVFEIAPSGNNFTAQMTFVPEAPELWN